MFQDHFHLLQTQLVFEVREDDKYDTVKDGVLLHDVKVIGAVWDPSKKCLKKSE